ncbi:hypothetical protein FIBSPDRAFT_1047278 [Athelia psychrophila]|uniref:Uncharacterized protein n=1 Tax=Athelia psychrophila TaxID=1759441 RepID=A0A166FHU0_9AGAM|nr:hypothetical protein FIBSPDRAFT_1047278 [Fibularhizoctonia sp. CBS 109695]
MLHHASRLRGASPVKNTLVQAAPFADILQLAAGRAWARCASSNSLASSRARRARTPAEPPPGPSILAVRLNPRHLTPHDTTTPDPGRAFDTDPIDPSDYHIRLKHIVPPPLYSPDSTLTRPALTLARALTPAQLTRNLLAHSTTHPLPALIAHHAHHQHARLRTRASYTALVGLALRHTATHVALSLLRAMGREVGADVRAWALWVRAMVRQRRWEEAWGAVQSAVADGEWRARTGTPAGRWEGPGMPLVVWLEFLAPPRRMVRPLLQPVVGGVNGEAEAESDATMGAETYRGYLLWMNNANLAKVEARRLPLLAASAPSLRAEDVATLPPRAVYLVVWSFLLRRDHKRAHDLTAAFLHALPASTTAAPSPGQAPRTVRTAPPRPTQRPSSLKHAHRTRQPVLTALAIIHLHILFRTTGPGSALKRHTLALRDVDAYTALGAHAGLRPAAHTLFMLLAPLKGAAHAGTHARRAATKFVRRWGAAMESARVRQRIAAFAVKEGNTKLALREMRKEEEEEARWREGTREVESEVTGGGAGRPRVFQRRGVERVKWTRVERGVRRRRQRRRQVAGEVVCCETAEDRAVRDDLENTIN